MKSLEGIDRSKIDGFMEYFSQREEHFRSIYHMEYNEENAKKAHIESKNLVRECRHGSIDFFI